MRERMKEEEPNWFSKWEEQLPPPEELTPLHQTLITPDLALAFNIRSPTPNFTTTTTSPYINHPHHPHSHHRRLTPPPPPPPPPPTHPDFDNSSSAELTGNGSSGGGGAGSGGEEPARTLKRPRLVWTPQLHKRFVDAVAHLGIKNAVPKTIMQLMSVDGLTRENVASHLQKYRLYLKRMQGLNGNSGGGGAGTGSGDSATDHLFASSPVPPHFLHQSNVTGGGPGSVGIVNGVTRGHNAEHFLPYVPPAMAAIHHHHQQQMTAVAVTNGPHHPGNQSHYHGHHPHHHHHSKQIGAGQFGNGEQQLPFQSSSRQAQIGGMMMMMQSQSVGGGGYVEEIESGTVGVKNGREMLTLFPTGGD